MLRTTLLSVAFTWFVTTLTAQTDSMFIHLDKSSVTSGILLESGMDSLYRLYEFDGQQAYSAEKKEWSSLLHLMRRRQFAGELLPASDTLQEWHRKAEYDWMDQGSLVRPVFIHLLNYHYIKSYAVDSGLVTLDQGKYYDSFPRSESPYDSSRAVISGIYNDKAPYSNTISFLFSQDYFISNKSDTLTGVEIDPGDGQGYRTVNLDNPLTVTYDTNEYKNILLRVYTDDTTYHTGFRIKVGNPHICNAPFCPDDPPWTTEPAPPGWAPFTSNPCYLGNTWLIKADIAYQGRKALGNAYIKYGTGSSELTKPLIMVEGIDFGNHSNAYLRSPLQHGDIGWCQPVAGGNNNAGPDTDNPEKRDWYGPFMYKYPDMITQLRDEGYDVIILR